jgi:hypothetical protein
MKSKTIGRLVLPALLGFFPAAAARTFRRL